MLCEEYGCLMEGIVECYLPPITMEDGHLSKDQPPTEHFCQYHAYKNGFCSLCGDFWGGIESFEFDNPQRLCENCLDQLKTELGEYDDDEEDMYGELDY